MQAVQPTDNKPIEPSNPPPQPPPKPPTFFKNRQFVIIFTILVLAFIPLALYAAQTFTHPLPFAAPPLEVMKRKPKPTPTVPVIKVPPKNRTIGIVKSITATQIVITKADQTQATYELVPNTIFIKYTPAGTPNPDGSQAVKNTLIKRLDVKVGDEVEIGWKKKVTASGFRAIVVIVL